jgi:hypothetical protein
MSPNQPGTHRLISKSQVCPNFSQGSSVLQPIDTHTHTKKQYEIKTVFFSCKKHMWYSNNLKVGKKEYVYIYRNGQNHILSWIECLRVMTVNFNVSIQIQGLANYSTMGLLYRNSKTKILKKKTFILKLLPSQFPVSWLQNWSCASQTSSQSKQKYADTLCF